MYLRRDEIGAGTGGVIEGVIEGGTGDESRGTFGRGVRDPKRGHYRLDL